MTEIERLQARALPPEADALPEVQQAYLKGHRDGSDLAHEPAKCGHARANYKDPSFGTPAYQGNERCEFCEAVQRLEQLLRDVLPLVEWCGNDDEAARIRAELGGWA